jgi:hypothetical protein
MPNGSQGDRERYFNVTLQPGSGARWFMPYTEHAGALRRTLAGRTRWPCIIMIKCYFGVIDRRMYSWRTARTRVLVRFSDELFKIRLLMLV